MTFFSNSHLKVKRNDSVPYYMDTWAWDLYIEEKYYTDGEGENSTEDSNSLIIEVTHPEIKAVSYGCYNYDSCKKKINIDMNFTKNVTFSQKYGIRNKEVYPDGIEYISSVVSDPDFGGKNFDGEFKYKVQFEDGSEPEYSESESESEDSD